MKDIRKHINIILWIEGFFCFGSATWFLAHGRPGLFFVAVLAGIVSFVMSAL